MMSNGYAIALESMRKAESEYQAVLSDYRSMKIGDAEYLAARAIHAEAVKAFDLAYALAEVA